MTESIQNKSDDVGEKPRDPRARACKRCPAWIIFLRTKLGKTTPVDAGAVLPDDEEFDAKRHTSHFATCPAAASFRKTEKKSAKKEKPPKPVETMTMVFRDPFVLNKFISLCKQHGLHGTMKPLDSLRTEVKVVGFKNKTARTSFLSTWGELTVERT